MVDAADIDTLCDGIMYLTGGCSPEPGGSLRRFGAVDAIAGYYLEGIPRWQWDDHLAGTAAKLLSRYRRVLRAGGYDLAVVDRVLQDIFFPSTVADWAKVNGHRDRRLKIDGNTFHVMFKPWDEAFDIIKTAVKAIPDRQFDSVSRCWMIPVEQVAPIARLAGTYLFQLDTGIYRAFAAAEPRLRERESQHRQAVAPYTTPDGVTVDLAWRIDLADNDEALTLHFPPPQVSNAARRANETVRTLGALFDPATSTWTLRFSTAPEDLIDHISRLQERYGFGLHRDALAALDREIDRQVRAKAASRATEADVDVPGLAGTLHPVQRAAVAYLRENRRTLMADETGLGKTVSSIAAVQDQGAYPVIVLAPAAQVPHWQQETAAWLPDTTRVRRFGGTGRWPTGSTTEGDRHGDVIVASYEAARENRETLLDLGANAVILDDARFVRNPYAQRTDAATAIAKQADLRLLLTDEPMLNRPQDLIHPLRILDKLDAFGGFRAFTRRYCNAEETRFGLDLSGAANTDELAEKLRRVGYLRRLTQDVQCELRTQCS